tara:strand:+ start:182420 stop:183001 length:582 start_codon:yes stop_codon:yes gene_type:complete
MIAMRKTALKPVWLLSIAAAFMSASAFAAGPADLLERLNAYPHAKTVEIRRATVVDHEVGLGAIQKFSGVWRFKDSIRLSGELERYTWQIIDGFSSSEVMAELVDELQQSEHTQLLFSCEGRACGRGNEWANTVFEQRVLYGLEDRQRYSVYSLGENDRYRLMLYSAMRTADRQYLHADLLTIDTSAESDGPL